MKGIVGVAGIISVGAAALYLRPQTKNPSKDKGVNKRFFEQLKFLLRICIPHCKSVPITQREIKDIWDFGSSYGFFSPSYISFSHCSHFGWTIGQGTVLLISIGSSSC